MSTDQEQPQLDDVQKSFLESSTQREIPCKVHVMGEHKAEVVEITVRRWTLSQQVTLGPSLTKIVQHLLAQMPAMMGDQIKEGEEIKVDLKTMMSASYNIGTIVEALFPDIQKVLIGSLAHNFSGDSKKTAAFVESLEDFSEALELLLLIGSLNMLRDTAKKKYHSLAKLFQSAGSSQP